MKIKFGKKKILFALFILILIIFIYRYRPVEHFDDDDTTNEQYGIEDFETNEANDIGDFETDEANDIEDFRENYDNYEYLIQPNDGHARESMLRYDMGSSVASSGMTKPQGLCCVRFGCKSCGGKYPNQKKYGCKKWQKCEKNRNARHEYQSKCTGCGADKKSILSQQKDNWW